MTTVGRLSSNGDLLIAGQINERLPVIKNGLIAHYPFDNYINGFLDIKGAKVGGYFGSGATSHPWYDWCQTNASSFTNIDLTTLTVDQAKQYNLIVYDMWVWACDSTIISKLKDFVDAGVSCIAVGNDTRTNIFVASYNATPAVQTHDIIVDSEAPIDLSGKLFTGVGSIDLYGGIVTLQNGAIPAYRRADYNLISGYIYESPISGAVFYFDQEGISITTSFVNKLVKYALGRENIGIVNQGTTLTNDGMSIEDSTTNLILNGNFGDKTGIYFSGRDDNLVVYDYNIPINGYAVRLERYDSQHFMWYQDVRGQDQTKTYTMSEFVKLEKYTSGVIGANLYFYYTDGSYTNTAKQIDYSKIGEWQYITTTGTPDQNKTLDYIRVYAPWSNNLNGSFLCTGIQLEQKSFATSYVNGSRSTSGSLTIPLNIDPKTQSFSLNFWMTPNGKNVTDGNSYISLNNFGKMWSYFPMGGDTANRRYIWDFVVNTGASRVYVDLIDTNVFVVNNFEMITLVWDYIASTMSVYRNGILWKSRITTVDCTLGVIDSLIFNIPQMKIRNVSIYNKVLSTNEITMLTGEKTQIDSSGNFISCKIIEKPNSIPNNSKYFPLNNDGLDYYKIISPLTDTVDYSERVAWVGDGTTNIALNPTMEDNDSNNIPESFYVHDGDTVNSPVSYKRENVYGRNMWKIIGNIISGSFGYSQRINPPTIASGDTITLTAWVYDPNNLFTDTQGIGFTFWYTETNTSGSKLYSDYTWYNQGVHYIENLGNGLKKIVHTGTGDSTKTMDYLEVRLWCLNATANATFWIEKIQLEKLSFSTPFVSVIRADSYLKFSDMKTSPQLPSLKPLTYNIFFKVHPSTANSNDQRLFSSTEAGGFALYLRTDGKLQTDVYVNGAYKSVISTNDYRDNNWHMATLVINTDDIIIYCDGIEVGRNIGAVTGYDIQYTTSVYNLFVGAENGGGTPVMAQSLKGYIRDFSAFNIEMSATDIYNMYKVKMRDYSGYTLLQNQIKEGVVL